MKINTFKYFVVDASKSLRRNITISFASIITVAATLFIFGIFLLLMNNTGKLVDTVNGQVEIKVFLKLDVTPDQKDNIETALKQDSEVQSVKYETKEEALANFKNMMGQENKDILSGYDEDHNPFQTSFIVRLKAPEYAKTVQNRIKDMSGIDEVKNDQQLINIILSISKAVKWIGIAIFALLVGVSLFLIVNTIRLTVFSRRREIGIMKFVGATDWFIRWPFIIEGMVIGIVGSIVSNIGLYYLYKFAVRKLVSGAIVVPQFIPPTYVSYTLSWQFAIAGAAIGAIGSIIALRRFLAV
ncbi:MAG: permease-like cell division protein FtsX [Bacillota bacterium]|nr:permease-like cell division protein FtsX [Bacillota bacterium]